MATVDRQQALEEFAQLGTAVFERCVQPKLLSTDHGKFVAVDTITGEYEIDADEYAAVSRLRMRLPQSETWLARAGFPNAYVMR